MEILLGFAISAIYNLTIVGLVAYGIRELLFDKEKSSYWVVYALCMLIRILTT